MNKETREIIRKVLPIVAIQLPKTGYVCIAAKYARIHGFISFHEEETFVKFINKRIEGCFSVMEWLMMRHGIAYSRFPVECRLEYRKRWVQQMIEEFSG